MKESKVRIDKSELVSDFFYTYKKITYSLKVENDRWDTQTREILDRGDGATILLYNKATQKIILTRQFRLPTYLNKNPSGLLIEACAGSVEDETPLENIIRETEEETGYRIRDPKKIFEAYTSPAAVTEIVHFYLAEYDSSMKQSAGGGNADEHEHIEVLELDFKEALRMLEAGEIRDAKTILLLQYVQLKCLM